ncbi:hypothetical protein A2U01_0028391, partial [Trifolium medium]|nr:hypothetical protein [Trifolium medium]
VSGKGLGYDKQVVNGSNLDSKDGARLVCSTAALSPWDKIGSHGARNFVLCKKPHTTNEAADDGSGSSASGTSSIPRRGSSGSWKSWFNLNLKISSH